MLAKLKAGILDPVVRGVSARWNTLSVFRRFGVATSLVLVVGMLLIGSWVADHVESGVVQSVGVGVALNTNSLIVSDLQSLKGADVLPPDVQADLDQRLTIATNPNAIVAFHIWKGDVIVASSDKTLIGKSFPPTATRAKAWTGVVSVEFDSSSNLDSEGGRLHPMSLFEVYAPVWEMGTDRIIAVAETYVMAPGLRDQIRDARLFSWSVIGFATVLMMFLQIVIVDRGGVMIDNQQSVLKEKVEALALLLKDNELLRMKANQASKRVAEMHDTYARQLGVDLHDGPVQLLGLSLLRLDSLSQIVAGAEGAIAQEAETDLAVIREAMSETLQEIRSISTGLAPPNVDGVTLQGALELACRRHERQTGRPVRSDFKGLPEGANHPLNTCLYRFAQEGLNNALRHAGGKGESIVAWCDGEVIEVRISDHGPGLGDPATIFTRGGSGIVGMRDRIEALGGDFVVDSRLGKGTCIIARFSVKELPSAHE